MKKAKQEKKNKGAKGKRRIRILDILMVLLLMTGVGVLAYPFVQDALNDYLAQELISHYQNQANKENEAELVKTKAEMDAKNKELAEKEALPGMDAYNAAVDAVAQTDVANNSFYEEHTIGILSIPKIDVNLPIFDETTEIFLQKGLSLLEGSSYPTGGESTHAVLSGHRGLPEAKLFTDLPELVIGDQFFVQINNETLAYEVEKIQTIEPTDTEPLRIQAGRDLVTLMTCTPYMVNTHRLLVTGHRIPYTAEKAEKAIKKVTTAKRNKLVFWLVGVAAAFILLLWGLLRFLRLLAIGKKRYPVEFYVLDSENQSVVGATFSIKTKNGRRNVTRNQEPIILTSDDKGLVAFPDLKGGRYRLVGDCGRLKIKIKKAKDEKFHLQLLHKKQGTLVLHDERYSLITTSTEKN